MLLFTGGRILCTSARNKADLNEKSSFLFHGLTADFILQQTALLNPMYKGQGVSSASPQNFEKTVDEIKLIVQKPKCFLFL